MLSFPHILSQQVRFPPADRAIVADHSPSCLATLAGTVSEYKGRCWVGFSDSPPPGDLVPDLVPDLAMS